MSILVFSLVIFLTAYQQLLAAEPSTKSGENDYEKMFKECDPYFENLIITIEGKLVNETMCPCFYDVMKKLNIAMESLDSDEKFDLVIDFLYDGMESHGKINDQFASKIKECSDKVEEDIKDSITVHPTPECEKEMKIFDDMGEEMRKRRK